MLVNIKDYADNHICINLDKVLYMVESRSGNAKDGWKSYIRVEFEDKLSIHILFKEETDAYDTLSILEAMRK